MEDNKNIHEDERTEELPVSDNVTWHREEEDDLLSNNASDNDTHMTPITADESYYQEDRPVKVKKVVKKKVRKKNHSTKQSSSNNTKQKPQPTKQPTNKKVEEEPKSNKKLIIITSIIIGVILLGTLGYYFITQYTASKAAKQAAYDKIYNQLKITFVETSKDEDGNLVDPTIFEYGSEAGDPMDLVDTHYGEVTVTPEKIDTSKVGAVTLTYTASMEDSYNELVTRDFTLDVTIHDTQSPTIEFNESSITITEGDEFDAKTNIKSVSDPVDGDLEYVEEEPDKDNKKAPYYEKGWYTITSDVDTETVGNYTVRLKATDINGNSTDLAYTVTVKQKEPTQFMSIGTYNLKKITSLNQFTDPEENASSETGSWADVDNYLGNVQYKDETQYTSQDEMVSAAQSYLKENFDSLANTTGTTSVLGISLEYKQATAYYMAALDDKGEVMYYFFAIV